MVVIIGKASDLDIECMTNERNNGMYHGHATSTVTVRRANVKGTLHGLANSIETQRRANELRECNMIKRPR